MTVFDSLCCLLTMSSVSVHVYIVLITIETSGRSDTSLTSSCVQEVSQEFDGMLLSRSVTSFPSTDHTVFHDGASKIQVTIPSDSTDSGEVYVVLGFL